MWKNTHIHEIKKYLNKKQQQKILKDQRKGLSRQLKNHKRKTYVNWPASQFSFYIAMSRKKSSIAEISFKYMNS